MSDLMKKDELWVAVDFDGTLVEYHGERDPQHIGKEVPATVALVRHWLSAGVHIAIFTARVSESKDGSDRALAYHAIQNWLALTFGVDHSIIITADKDPRFAVILDDRAVNCLTNRGVFGPLPTILAPPSAPPTVPDLLRAGADLYEERSATYGSNYQYFGRVMDGMFPRGFTIEPGDVEGWNRFALVFMALVKISRYVQNPLGHLDSASDLKVYGAMLEELTSHNGTPTS